VIFVKRPRSYHDNFLRESFPVDQLTIKPKLEALLCESCVGTLWPAGPIRFVIDLLCGPRSLNKYFTAILGRRANGSTSNLLPLTLQPLLEARFFLGWFVTLKIEVTRNSETSSVHMRSTQRYIPQDGNICCIISGF
jgi:hypothetical protein